MTKFLMATMIITFPCLEITGCQSIQLVDHPIPVMAYQHTTRAKNNATVVKDGVSSDLSTAKSSDKLATRASRNLSKPATLLAYRPQ